MESLPKTQLEQAVYYIQQLKLESLNSVNSEEKNKMLERTAGSLNAEETVIFEEAINECRHLDADWKSIVVR